MAVISLGVERCWLCISCDVVIFSSENSCFAIFSQLTFHLLFKIKIKENSQVIQNLSHFLTHFFNLFSKNVWVMTTWTMLDEFN